MNILKAALYDPAAAVSKATSALLAMTAIDTVNLRLAIVVPAHGMVRFRQACAVTGATTPPVVLLGVMNGATVIGRAVPVYSPSTAPLATHDFQLEAEYTVTGLTPGAMNVDAAYAVQVLVAATNIKYGGPNTNAGNNAWGGYCFEAFDPQPLKLALDGGVNVTQVGGTAQTAGDLKASLNTLQADTDDIQTRLPAALVGGRMDGSVGAMAANVLTAAAINAAALNGKGDWNIGKTGYALSAAGVQAIWDALTAALTTAASIGKLLVDNINATISSRAPSATALSNVDYTAARAAKLDNADVAVSTRLASAGYAAPPSAATITAAVWDELIAGHAVLGSTGAALTLAGVPSLDAAGIRTAIGLGAANLDTQLAAIAGYIDTEVAAILAAVGTLTVAERNAIADAVLGRNVAGGSSAGRTVKEAVAFMRNKWTLVGDTLTVYDTDDTTVLWTSTVTRGAGDPVSSSDPA